MKYVLLLVSTAILSACQSAESSDSTATTRPATIDVSGYPDLTAKEDRDKVSNFWEKTVSKNPQYPMQAAREGISGCVEIVFAINHAGKPEGYRIVASYPEGTFNNNAIAALARWRWEPTPANSSKQPVLTSTQLDFVVSGAENTEEARARCDSSHHMREFDNNSSA